MSGEGAAARARRGRGGGGRTHRQLSAERGLPMARGPGSTENPGGITPARGRPRGRSRGRRRPRKAGAREAGGGPDAAPRVPWNVELAAPCRVALRRCRSRWPLAAQEPERAGG